MHREKGKRSLVGRPGHISKESIKMDFKETGREDVDWIHLGKGRVQWQAVVNMEMNLWVPYKTNFLTIWRTICLSRTIFHGVSSSAAAAAFMPLSFQM
jgi:hypothetical protein